MKVKEHPGYQEQMSQLGRHHWAVSRLIELSKDLPVMDVPLDHMNVYKVYNGVTLRELVGHVRAVNDADLSYPIILDEDGEILDGRHRIMKALLIGAKTIKAVKFQTNPSPCRVDKD